MLQAIYNTTVNVTRRVSPSASRDSLNNPVYGLPTTWNTVYTAMPARLAFNAKPIIFAQTAERIVPNGIMYMPPNYTVYHEDRVITTDGIEYVVVSVVPGYVMNTVIDHWEVQLALP